MSDNNQTNKNDNDNGAEQPPELNDATEDVNLTDDATEIDASVDEPVEDAPEEDELALLQDKLQRTFAELENTRRRFDREKQESTKYAIAGFASDILSLADNLERALQAVPPKAKQENEAFGNFVEGVALSAKELNSIFERNHIKKIAPALGDAFSANQHQAVSELPSDTHPKGTIVQILQPGYALHDRLIRPAMVMVSAGGIAKKVDVSA